MIFIMKNLIFPILFLNSYFNDIFQNSPSQEVSNTGITEFLTNYYGYYIKQSTFIDLSSNYNHQINVLVSGAVHFHTTKEIDLLIDNVMFFNCSAGGIYFNCPRSGSIYINKVCASRCKTDDLLTNIGQFAFITVSPAKKAIVLYLSMSFCSPDSDGDRNEGFHVENGQIYLSNCNFSNNRAYQIAATNIVNPELLNISFSTYSDNTPTHSVCFNILSANVRKNISFTNFVRNTSPLAPSVIFISISVANTYNTTFSTCVFQQNQNTLIYTPSRYIFIVGGWINHHSSYAFQTGYVPLFIGVTNSPSYSTITPLYDHFTTYHCNPLMVPQGQEVEPCQTLPPQCSNIVENNLGLSFIFNFIFLTFHSLHFVQSQGE